MSMETVFYVGPYFKVEDNLTNEDSLNFEKKFKDSMVHWANDKDGFSCWIPNLNKNPSRNFRLDRATSEGEVANFCEYDIDEEKEWLMQKFKKEKKELSSYFVYEYTVETEWGILCRYC